VGSPITFSGFNNIDFNLILGAVMEQARQPLAVLESQQSGVQARISTFGTLTSKVLALKTAAEAMNGLAKVSTLSGKSSDATAVGVSVGTAAPAGTVAGLVTAAAFPIVYYS
jgi:flagellar hook-associated protein 2